MGVISEQAKRLSQRLIDTDQARREAELNGNLDLRNMLANASADLVREADPAELRALALSWMLQRTRDAEALAKMQAGRPHIITICGSTRFKDEIHAANARLTLEGNLVISLGVFGHTDMPDVDWSTGGTDLKVALDDLHRQKIRLADSIYVATDESGYFGESTAGEIAFAISLGKPVVFANEAAEERWNGLA